MRYITSYNLPAPPERVAYFKSLFRGYHLDHLAPPGFEPRSPLGALCDAILDERLNGGRRTA